MELPDGTEATLYQLWVRPPGHDWEATGQGDVFVAPPGFDLIDSVLAHSTKLRAGKSSRAAEEDRVTDPLLHLMLLDLGGGRSLMNRGDRREYVITYRRPHDFEELGQERKRRYAKGAASEPPIPVADVVPLDPDLKFDDLKAYVALACLRGKYVEAEAAEAFKDYSLGVVKSLASVASVPQLQDLTEDMAGDVLLRVIRSWYRPSRASSLRSYVTAVAKGLAASMDTRAAEFAAAWQKEDEVRDSRTPRKAANRKPPKLLWTVDEAVAETEMERRRLYREIKKRVVPVAQTRPIRLDATGIDTVKAILSLRDAKARKSLREAAETVRGTSRDAARMWVNRRLHGGMTQSEIEAELAQIAVATTQLVVGE